MQLQISLVSSLHIYSHFHSYMRSEWFFSLPFISISLNHFKKKKSVIFNIYIIFIKPFFSLKGKKKYKFSVTVASLSVFLIYWELILKKKKTLAFKTFTCFSFFTFCTTYVCTHRHKIKDKMVEKDKRKRNQAPVLYLVNFRLTWLIIYFCLLPRICHQTLPFSLPPFYYY